MRNFDESEETKVQRNLNQIVRYFMFLDDRATDDKGKGWGINTADKTLKF